VNFAMQQQGSIRAWYPKIERKEKLSKNQLIKIIW
jgi:hypothetical protein